MVTALSRYLDTIRGSLRLDPSTEREIITELEAHIEDSLQDMRTKGLSEEEATENCLSFLGSAKLFARQICEVYNRGTWRQALLASMPYALLGLLFALNWWDSIGWLLVMVAVIIGTAIHGWHHGKPAWLFPWLGCSLIPLLIAGLFLFYLPRGWAWLVVLLYIPLVLWLLYVFTVQAIRRDWLYSALMLLPVPIIISWFMVLKVESHPAAFSFQRMEDFAVWIGLSFLALGITGAIFVRLKQRWLKTAALIVSGVLTLAIIAYFATSRLGLPTLFLLALGMVGLFLAPALLEHRMKARQRPAS